MPIPWYRPLPAPPGIFKNRTLPEQDAGILSRITFQWVTGILKVGYTRPIEADDLWRLPRDLQCQEIANNLQARLDKDNASLLRSMYGTVKRRWWFAVSLKLLGATLQVTSPLVARLIIEQISKAHAYHTANADSLIDLDRPKSIGYGIGLSMGLFTMLSVASLLVYQSLQIGSVIGFMMRGALIDLIGRKSFASRHKLGGNITTMVSADASYLDFSAPMTIDLFVQPIQILVGIALIIYTLGYSALVGLGVLCLAGPIQAYMFARMVKYRQLQLVHIDARVKLLTQVVKSIRHIKLYAYTRLFGDKVQSLRVQELSNLRVNGVNRATMNATMSFIPVLAAVLTFVTYGLSGHDLEPAIIFSGLQFFNVLRTPISFLPMCFTAVSDAVVAMRRIENLLHTKELSRTPDIQEDLKFAIVADGNFTYQDSDTQVDNGRDEVVSSDNLAEPFCLRDIHLRIPKGSLVCISGRIGSGKSALLQALLGEMRQTTGRVVLSGNVSYVPQEPWIHSGTIRDNVTFFQSDAEIDQLRLQSVIESCCLVEDIKGMPMGLRSAVGEKGSLLSGGQKQRLALARAAYDVSSSIVLLDDCLSALDPAVSQRLLKECILNGPLSGKTRILVTHNRDVLRYADWVVQTDRDGNEGRISWQGCYKDLSSSVHNPDHQSSTLTGDAWSNKLNGRIESRHQTISEDVTLRQRSIRPNTIMSVVDPITTVPMELNAGMEEEERNIGAVSLGVYKDYSKATGSILWLIASSALLIMTQVFSVTSSLFLGWWSGDEFGLDQYLYMVIYGVLGLAMAMGTWSSSIVMFLAGLRASNRLFKTAWDSVLRAKISWHDSNPSGRVISRLSKDVEQADDRLAYSWEQFISTCLAVVGTFALVVYTYPYLSPAFVPLVFLCYLCAAFYRQTSREVKRVDSVTRSAIYTAFSGQFEGCNVIRIFRHQENFQSRLQHAINQQCQAYIITLTIQRWLGIRLDLFSNILVVLVAVFGTIFRESVSPSRFGVVFTYTLATASLFANLVTLYAQVELEMNNVERIIHFTHLPLEPAPSLPSDPATPWPSQGAISFKNVSLRYKPDLPLVLKDLSFEIMPGEKVGVIGRTGAGKSSLLQAFFRLVELENGKIEIDGRDISKIGLDTLRKSIAVIPQDAFLFEGTVRENIDPEGICSDAQLNDFLQTVITDPATSPSLREKLRLDGMIENEGVNYSTGERQILVLIRALVKGSKIAFLDEATSSVDAASDLLVQRVMQLQCKDVTIIAIAHRLHTVAHFDRIMVLDKGSIVEFESPLRLYDNVHSIFRSLCNKAGIKRADLVQLRQDAEQGNTSTRDRMSLFQHFEVAEAWEQRGPF